MKRWALFFLTIFSLELNSQIVIDNTTPYDNPAYLVDNILLGGGIVASNHTFQGEPSQIGWFNAINTNLGIDSGIVMCTGDIYALDPINIGAGGGIPNTVTDPDLLLVAQSVPDLIGDNFEVTSVNDIAVLEFDFIPTSDTLKFRYAFGSQEYFFYENSNFNDVFGFFLSGPGIAGPWDNGAVNLAVVPNTNPPLPITISSICNNPNSFFNNGSGTPSVMNPQYFVDNSYITSNLITDIDTIADADGFTTVLTAQAVVQCGATYHIKLAIADGTDSGLSSYVWLEAGSFFSPPLSVVDDLNIDSTLMTIPCNAQVTLTADGGLGATYEWFDSTSTVFSTNQSVLVGAGQYVVSSNILGCAVISDTLTVTTDPDPNIDLGLDTNIACGAANVLVDPLVSGGSPPYSFDWDNDGVSDSDTISTFSPGIYIINVVDSLGCSGSDTLEITEDPPPIVDLGLDYTIACNTTTTLIYNIIGGTSPYTYLWNTNSTSSNIDVGQGNYVLNLTDSLGCSDIDTIIITEEPKPIATISGGGAICADSSTNINFTFNGLLPWDLTYTDGSSNYTMNNINNPGYSFSTTNAGNYGIVLANDINDCVADTAMINLFEVVVNPLPIAEITPGDVVMYIDETVELNTGNYAFYEWYTEYDSLIGNNQSLIVQDSGRYKVWVEDQNGCTDISEFATVRLVPLTQLFVPSVFTPNNDEHNELFVIQGRFVESFNIKIFNRWGQQLFESDNMGKYWDGTFENKRVQQGTYYYQIEALGFDGKLYEKPGTVQVIY